MRSLYDIVKMGKRDYRIVKLEYMPNPDRRFPGEHHTVWNMMVSIQLSDNRYIGNMFEDYENADKIITILKAQDREA